MSFHLNIVLTLTPDSHLKTLIPCPKGITLNQKFGLNDRRFKYQKKMNAN